MRPLLVHSLTLLAVFAEDHGVLGQMLFSAQTTSSADDTATRDGHIRRDIALALKNVLLADLQGLNGAPDFEMLLEPITRTCGFSGFS